jgi:hypothetical protein
MAQPVWITPAGSLGVIPEGIFYQQILLAEDSDSGTVTYELIAGSLPAGVQLNSTGTITGVPAAVARVAGVPLEVSEDVTSKFTIRAFSSDTPTKIRDRTFTLTITGDDAPEFTTPAGSLGVFYDGDELSIQIGYTDTDPADVVVVRLVAGELPGGITVSPSGLISGYIRPAPNVDEPPGYDLTPIYTLPYDFVVSAINKNYQFTLEVTDGRSSNLRTFYFFVFDRSTMTADNSVDTADSTEITADETTERAPFIVNSAVTDLGVVRGDNYYAHQFIGKDYDTLNLKYAIAVNEGSGLPPGLTLDPSTGWYYGYIPDQGITQIDYSFNIWAFQADYVNPAITVLSADAATDQLTAQGAGSVASGQALIFANPFGGLTAGTIYYVDTVISEDEVADEIVFTLVGTTLTNETGQVQASLVIECTATSAGTNRITCLSTTGLGVGQPIQFTGTTFGGISAAATQIYYVQQVINATQFTIATSSTATSAVVLNTGSGSMVANFIVASRPYPYTITVAGEIDAEVVWLTDADLGVLENGDTSLLKIEAENRGGRELTYRLKQGAFNELPQGLQLLPSGEIVGRVSFNTFAIDLGSTIIDGGTTTWDSSFTFTVNAYAQDTGQILYQVDNVTIVDGGLGYSNITPPVIEFSTPVGASATRALVGNVTVSGGAITAVEVADSGGGYTSPATITITEGYGGTGAELVANMVATGVRDVVSVFKTFTVRVFREYNKPYQNLVVQAMPPLNDRVLIDSLLNNENIFVPEFIFRPDDPNFGKATRVNYQHAYGLSPDTIEQYVESLYLNHYWKNLVLGQIETAQALDSAGNVIYEVVYSRIIDNLVNADGESVNKIVNLPYTINTAVTAGEVRQVYPNSLINMRDQVIDVVGQISTKLPEWMTSKQANGRVLGFTPAWVLCYTNPGRSQQIAYYLQTQFGEQLNKVDFKVDRYILDRELSRNWDTATQQWTPEPNLTTFDRFNTAGYNFISQVSIATDLAYADVNQRTLTYINNLGGLDGVIDNINGNTLIFVKQEAYNGPPGSNYPTTNDAWQDYLYPYDSNGYDNTEFDEAVLIPDGDGSSINLRMYIYTISVDPLDGQITLTPTTATEANDYVQIVRGNFYRSAELYHASSPGQGLNEISWLPLETVTTEETLFDMGSVAFEDPVDMYDPTDAYDKYLVFPKTNILE